ncbi:MBL fold metallo-hydrolase [Aeromonas caviae]|uniref:MBL fold metallo-hydrolase n=1 Tax=Aeromonas caviae TaxID=648 RepID=UPI002648299C|nr:MBL fold metallo-hydrolase [Aeromonas caviae]MDN6868449.1 MBL fold metallo-hydrolase [Aeromonas caviae]
MKIDIIDAGHGDCLLVTCGESIILVDSGPESFRIRRQLTKSIKRILNGKPINIAIVTHNDDDHIGGYKYLMADGVVIQKFIFNSLDLIEEIIKKDTNNKKISFRQDRELQKSLCILGIDVQTFQYEDSPLTFNDITLTALTPNNDILERLNEKAKKKQHNKKISVTSRIEKSICESLLDLKNNNDFFIEDTSITNRSSISFILTYEKYNVLFLGDSHPSDIIQALKSKDLPNISFNAVKLSHHASEKNTNSELLKLIGNTDYIICADKSRHNHPNNKTICRIINFNKNAKIHMSSKNELITTMYDQCVVQGYKVSITYPENGVNRVVL